MSKYIIDDVLNADKYFIQNISQFSNMINKPIHKRNYNIKIYFQVISPMVYVSLKFPNIPDVSLFQGTLDCTIPLFCGFTWGVCSAAVCKSLILRLV